MNIIQEGITVAVWLGQKREVRKNLDEPSKQVVRRRETFFNDKSSNIYIYMW